MKKASSLQQKLFCTVFAQCFSPNGKYLAVADCFGRITIFKLSSVLSPHAENENRIPWYQFTHGNVARTIYCMVSNEKFLMCGYSDGFIRGFAWADLLSRNCRLSWEICACASSSPDGSPYEINGLTISADERYLCAATGDKNMYAFSIEGGQKMHTFSGHSDYLHCVCNISEDMLATGSEDGTVRLWDIRSSQTIRTIEPAVHKETIRPKLGKWIGCVASDGNWLVCGGGLEMTMWHLGSYTLAKVLTSTEKSQHFTANMHEDKILCAGSHAGIYQWNFRGDFISDVPSDIPCIYDLSINTKNESYKMLTAAGDSSKLDVYLNFGYKSFSLSTIVNE